MTVLDPPQRTLRLVASSNDESTRDHRYRDGAHLHGPNRDLYREVLQQALATQTAINPDALRVVLAAKQNTTAGSAREFSATGIWQLMFVDVVTWCRNRHLKVPSGCADALVQVIEHLDTTGSLDELSDPVWRLFDAIDECTGGWVEDLDSAPSRTRKPTRRRSKGGSHPST